MKRTDLLRALAAAARAADLELVLVREGAGHSIYRIGAVQFSVPRHREINEITARAIRETAATATWTGDGEDA